MPRRLRIQYPDAIYHVMARGNGRQDIVCDDHDRDRLRDILAGETSSHEWSVYAFILMSHHLHVVLKALRLYLARGMQRSLFADWQTKALLLLPHDHPPRTLFRDRIKVYESRKPFHEQPAKRPHEGDNPAGSR